MPADISFVRATIAIGVSIVASIAVYHLADSALGAAVVVVATLCNIWLLRPLFATPPDTERTRQGHEGLSLVLGDQETVAELYERYYTGSDAPDWSDQFSMLRDVHDNRRITILRQDRDGEYWIFYLYRNDLPGLARDGCQRQFYQDFQKVHGDERLSDEHLFVVRG